MPSISSITKQYAGGLRQQQKGGQGGGVLGFLGMGGENKDDSKNVTVDDPILSEPKKEAEAAEAAAEPSFVDNALSAIGLGKKSEDEVSGESNAAEQPAPAVEPPAPAPAPAAEPTPAPAAEPTPAAEPAPASGDNVSMMDKLKGAFGMGGEPAKDDAMSDATSAESSDAMSDASSAESSDDEEEDNGVDFEKFAEEIQTLRNKYQQLKEENKQLKSAKKTEPVQADTSEFSKMIASFFAIKGSVAQLQLSLKKHADQNGFPVDGLGLDNESESESEPESEPESESESEPEPDMKEESSTPPPPNTSTEEEIPEIPVNAQASEVPVPASEVPVPASEVPVPPSEVPVPEPEVPVSAPEVPVSAPEVPVSPSEVPVSAPEVPVSEPEVPVSEPEAPAPMPGAPPATSNSLFSGGKNHYVQNIKNNKTHRHHKRRNRHQTLRAAIK